MKSTYERPQVTTPYILTTLVIIALIIGFVIGRYNWNRACPDCPDQVAVVDTVTVFPEWVKDAIKAKVDSIGEPIDTLTRKTGRMENGEIVWYIRLDDCGDSR